MSTKKPITNEKSLSSSNEDQPLAEKTSTWKEIKKVFYGQILSIVLTPLTVFVTLYATEKSKVADAKIDDHSFLTNYQNNSPAHSFYDSLKNDAVLFDLFQRRLDQLNPSPQSAKHWLTNESGWDDDCQEIFKGICLSTIAEITTEEKRSKLINLNNDVNSRREMEVSKLICNKFIQIIDKLNQTDSDSQTPTGQLVFELYILNKSSYDGLIYKNAKLEFNDNELTIESDTGYVQLKPHSLQKISFPTFYDRNKPNKLSQDKDIGNSTTVTTTTTFPQNDKEYLAYKNLALLVKERKKVSFKLTVTVDGKELPPQEYTIN